MKEAFQHIDNDIIFREIFRDEQTVRRNHGVPTDVVFSNGVATNATGYIDYLSMLLTDIFSIRIKFNITSLAGINGLFGNLAAANNHARLYVNTNGTVELKNDANATRTTTATLSINTDYDFVFTHNGTGASNIQFYINGVTFDSVISLSGTFTVRQLLALGNNTSPLVGTMDLFEIYNRALTAAEVANL